MKAVKRYLWGTIWNTAELFHINLGRFGPTVFGGMMGATGKRKIK